MEKNNSRKLNVILFEDNDEISHWLCKYYDNYITKKPRAVLGFATGTTPLKFYKLLGESCKKNNIDWSNITTFNLDEFIGVPLKHPESFYTQMWNNLFKHVNVQPENVNLPNGLAANLEAEAKKYEDLINQKGGIDLQYISLGVNGHMAYNEPGTSLDTYTHIAKLTEETRKEIVRQKKFPNLDQTPKDAITVGVRTILNFKQVFMVIVGENKAKPAKLALEGPISSDIPASALQNHPNCTFIIDKAASKHLDLSKYNVLSKSF